MTNMVKSAVEIVRSNNLEAVFDKGYHNAEEIHKCHQLGVEVHVAIPNPASNAPDTDFNVSEMPYNHENDTYECPAKQTLTLLALTPSTNQVG